MSEAFFQSQKTVDEACALIDRLGAENKRLRELVKEMETALSWRTPDEKAVDADLLRDDAHERKRLESEYPWKE
jgi:hypothetical protein